ncbi:unnamed protein product, partial [marine sediment metagenome]
IEGGGRDVPDEGWHAVFKGEQVVGLGATALKAGGWLGPRDSRTEWLAFGSVSLPVGARFRFEPTYFHSRDGQPGHREDRFLAAAEYAGRRVRMFGGLARGRGQRKHDTFDIWDGYVGASLAVGSGNRLQFLFRRESTDDSGTLTTVALGWSFEVMR